MRAHGLLLVCCLPLVHSGMRRADRAALVQLFRLLGGPYWTHNEGWDPDGGTDPCDMNTRWRGVGCIDPCDFYRDGADCAFGRVTALNLRDNNLTGSITNWTGIGDLHNLTYLDMSLNAISGSLPAEIGQIQNIEIISLSFNKLDGQLPTTLGNINSNGNAKLEEITLHRNNITGSLPTEIGRLTDLVMLNVGLNRMTGSIPTQLTNLTALQVFYAHGMSLEGTIPEDIGAMTALRYLNFSENNISGTLPPSVGNLGMLNDLSLFENRLSGSLPLELGNIAPLRNLRMQNNMLNGNFTEFTTLGNLRSLVTLDLYENAMVGDVPASLQNLTSLQYLYVDNQHLRPVRQRYCGQRIPNNGKYNCACGHTPIETQRPVHLSRLTIRVAQLMASANASFPWTGIIVRHDYVQMTSMVCENMHDTNFAFNSLQVSGVYPD